MLRVAVDHIVKKDNKGALNLSGSLTRQREQTLSAEGPEGHVANMGRMIEEMENQMRDALQTIYFGKTKTVVNGLYKAAGAAEEERKKELQRSLQAEMKK